VIEPKKQKLSFNEQIAHMRDQKGIGFSIINEKDALAFLLNHNYYFRIKAFAKNYEHYSDEDNERRGKYIDLEFAYLKELSILDMHFKNITHKILAAIEHFSKIQMLKDFEENNEDGYQIVRDFFQFHESHNNHVFSRVIQHRKGYCGDLIRKCCPLRPESIENQRFALWNIIEVLSFGDLILLFTFYYERNTNDEKDIQHITNLLWSARMLRNAIAHDNCLLNSLKNGYSNDNFKRNKQLNTFIQKRISTISNQTRKQRLSNPVVHDFIATLHLFNEIVTSKEIKKERMDELLTFIHKRCLSHKEYFEKNTVITSTYNFIRNLVDYYAGVE
jgi:hypothetical protein